MGMQHSNLWAPWRIGYIKGLGKSDAMPIAPPTAGTPAPESREGGCFLCEAADTDLSPDQRAERLVLVCDERGVLLLNRYPYTNGHLMVAPREHLGDLDEMTPNQRAALMELATLGQRLLKATMNPQGMNIGFNLGTCAGASLPGHAHLHLVPRWHGDVNFMGAIAGVRMIPQALSHTYADLLAALEHESLT